MQAALELVCPCKADNIILPPATGNALMACAVLNCAATSSCTAAVLACTHTILPWVLSPYIKVQGQLSQQQLLGLAPHLHQPAFVFIATSCARRSAAQPPDKRFLFCKAKRILGQGQPMYLLCSSGFAVLTVSAPSMRSSGFQACRLSRVEGLMKALSL